MSSNIWSINGTIHKHVKLGGVSEKLNNGVYIYYEDAMTGPYLTKIGDEFKFDYKIYGIEDEFINYVFRTVNSTQSNLGILLNGAKGTGKTITAKLICNKLNLPVIIVTGVTSGLLEFLSDVKQELVVFIDEFEKLFERFDHQEMLLPLMDGVLNSIHKRVFILTTNDLYINPNMLNRPGRIRYLKTFRNLSSEVYRDIVDDKLIHKEFQEEVLNFISTLELIVVDAVVTICEEVNIHKVSPETFKEYFNVSQSIASYDLYLMNPDSGVILDKPTLTSIKINLSDIREEENVYIDNHYAGTVMKLYSNTSLRMNLFCDVKDVQHRLILQDLIKLDIDSSLKNKLEQINEKLKLESSTNTIINISGVIMKFIPIYEKHSSNLYNLIY